MAEKIIRYKLQDAEFVSGEGELCFKDVLDDFTRAEYINILTYNISAYSNSLLDAVKSAGMKNIPIRIITNIPSRWEWYKYNNNRYLAKKSIEIYERKLNPESIGRLACVFFKFNNHGKIIMTNNIIYWGSANYSDESKKNYECGTISRDRKFINYVNEKVISEILKESTSYYDTEYNNCLLIMYSALSIFHNISQEIHDASFGISEDYDTNFEPKEYFDVYNNYITWRMLQSLMETANGLEDLLRDLQEELYENGKEYNESSLQEILLKYESYTVTKNVRIIDLCYEIEDLAKFDEDEFANNLLSGEYYSEAYDENLDYYAQLAFERGREKTRELIEVAEEYIKELLQVLDDYEIKLLEFINDVMKLANVNETIDNTGI